MSACIVTWITRATRQTPPGVHSSLQRGKGGSRSSGSIKTLTSLPIERACLSRRWVKCRFASSREYEENTPPPPHTPHALCKAIVYPVGDEGKSNEWLIFGLKRTPGLHRVFNLWRKEQKLEAPRLHPSPWVKLPRECKHSPQMSHRRSKLKHGDTYCVKCDLRHCSVGGVKLHPVTP